MTNIYDYIFIGGGTTGLATAVRLAELCPALSVIVLEAGKDVSAKPEVRIPASYVRNLGNPECDWSFFSIPQAHADGQSVFLPRGKSLGGSSNLNFMQMNRGTIEEHTSFAKLGIDGWSWGDLLPYFKKSEKLTASPDAQAQAHVTVNPLAHGANGPVDVTYPIKISVPHNYFLKAMNELGVPTNDDSSSGDNRGVWTSGCSVAPTTSTRVSADTAYLKNKSELTNLHIITEARVSRIVFKQSTDGEFQAEAVEYILDGDTKTVSAAKEIILSAGAYQTPQILELSGVGDPAILAKYGISTVIDLPTVGTNLQQEHVYASMSFELKPGFESWDVLRDPAVAAAEAQKFQTQGKGKLTTIPFAFAFLQIDQVWNTTQAAAIKARLSATAEANAHPFINKMIEIQKGWMSSVPFLEILLVSTFMPSDVKEYEEGKNYYTLAACLQHPLSQGTVHILSSDPTANPMIDPNFFANDLDLDVLVDGLEYCREIAGTEAFREITVKEVTPGPAQDLKGFVKRNLSPVFHPIGTAAMLLKEDGGVVDSELKVYGTKNLRVVDASILPLHFSAHPMATLYAIGEKTAEMIANSA